MNDLFVTSLEAIAVIPYLSQSHVFTENSSQLLFHTLSYSSRFSHRRLTSIHNIEKSWNTDCYNVNASDFALFSNQ